MKNIRKILAVLLCVLLSGFGGFAENIEFIPAEAEQLIIEEIPEAAAEESSEEIPEEIAAEPGAEIAVEEATIEIAPEISPEPTLEIAPEEKSEAVPADFETPGIVLEEEALILGVKEIADLKVSFDDGSSHALRYASDNARVAKVNKAGKVQAVAVGECTISVKSEFGEIVEVPVTVMNAPKKVKVDITEARMGVGQTLQLRWKLPDDCAGAVRLYSRNPKIASVDESGLITAIKNGSAVIRAEAYNGRYADVKLQIFAAPEGIEFREEEIVLGAGQKIAAKFRKELPDGSYTLVSDRPEIISVNEKGVIEAIAPGEALIVAETYNGHSASCRVSVLPAPEKISFREKEIVVCANDSYTLLPIDGANGTEVKLKINGKQFRLDGNRITGLYAGEGTLTAESYNGFKASIPVRCVAAPKKVEFKEKEITLFVGCDVEPGINAACSYSLLSSDSSIIQVEGNRIRAIAPGEAKVKATTFNKKTDIMQVHVPPLPDSVYLDADAILLGCGEEYRLNPRIPAGQGTAFRYESNDENVARVDASGNVQAVSLGSAVVSVHTLNGFTDSCDVTVLEAPTVLSLTPDRAIRSLSEGPFHLEISFGSENAGGGYNIFSSNPDVAEVSGDGMVTPVSAGNTVITVETYNGLRAKCEITLGETPSGMDFSENELFVALGDSVLPELQFDRGCESYSLAVQDPVIAEVNGNQLRGISIGSTMLTAISAGGLRAECVLTVVEAPTGLILDHSEEKLVLGVSSEVRLSAYALPGGVGSVRYESSDPQIASVDENGLVTALSMGKCVITATTYDGKHSAECAIDVRGVLDGVRIGIDPGHQKVPDYGYEPIAPGSSYRKKRTASGTRGKTTDTPEYVVNLQIGLKLRDALEAQGATVYMTRASHNVQISNVERAKMMNDLGVDLVLRIHCNGGSTGDQGMSIYVRQTGEKKAESVRAAKLVLKAMLQETGARDKGVTETDTYTGLNWSTVPSMLLEVGYLTNPKEEKLLISDDYQYKLVIGMVKGVCAYMERPIPDEILLSQEEKK